MGHLKLAQPRLCITARDDRGEIFVGTEQHLWPRINVNSLIFEEAIQIITK